MAQFRLLEAREVNARVNQVFNSEKWIGCSILLYKDARVDMALLDEIYGQYNWKVEYQQIGSSLFCTVSIWDKDKNEWIAKQSNGTESNMEAEKGQASDAFKRAGFMVGIGRELYTAPDIMVTLDASEVYQNQKTGKWQTNATFTVDEIGYNENREISRLVISKHFKKRDEVCFEWTEKGVKKTTPKADPKPVTSQEEEPKADTKPDWKFYYNELLKLCPEKDKLMEVCKKNGVESAVKLNAFFFQHIKRQLEQK